MKKLESLKLEKFANNHLSDLSNLMGGAQVGIGTYAQTKETHFDWMLGHNVTNYDSYLSDKTLND